jgi:hypothetical protein
LLDSSAKELASGVISQLASGEPKAMASGETRHDYRIRSGLPLGSHVRAAGIDVTHQVRRARSKLYRIDVARSERGASSGVHFTYSPKME